MALNQGNQVLGNRHADGIGVVYQLLFDPGRNLQGQGDLVACWFFGGTTDVSFHKSKLVHKVLRPRQFFIFPKVL